MQMNKPLVIFGASNFGDEVVQVFRDINAVTPTWHILGYLDDDATKWGSTRGALPVLGGMDWLGDNLHGLHVFVAIGNPPARKSVVSKITTTYKLPFATAIHPTVVSSPSNTYGQGTIIMAGTIMTTHIQIGNHVIINPGCTVGHNTTFGDFCTINPKAAIAGDIQLEEGTYVGIGATIINKLRIGRGAVVGAGAVAVHDVEPFSTVVGVPAKKIKTRSDDLSM
jgi:sugar O-acyltransferase (sialic acid O-acetyltransferase NeuD family)